MSAANPALVLFASPLDFIARPTPQLQDAARHQQLVLPPAEFADMRAAIKSVFEKYTAKLREFAPGVARGTALHRMMDHELLAAASFPLSCRKGCTGCCHYEVEITQDEAIILKNAVEGGLPIDQHRLKLQAARERQSPEWRQFGHADNRCVFLAEDGACRVYQDRPSICRKHVVTTPLSACTTPGAPVAPVQILLAEILLSAALSIEGTRFGSLAKMLLKFFPPLCARRSAKPKVAASISLRVGRDRRDKSRIDPPHNLSHQPAQVPPL